MGDPEADAENDVLRTEQIVQVCQSVMLILKWQASISAGSGVFLVAILLTCFAHSQADGEISVLVGRAWRSRGRDDLADAGDQQCAVSRYGRTSPPISSQDETMPFCFSLNNLAFSGKLESTAVLKAICAGFKESTEPHVCLTPGQ